MDPDKDWIRLHRGLLLNDLWTKEPFSQGQAWVDLLLVANWKDNRALLKGAVVPVRRGQLCRSMKQLSVRWGWSVGKVKRFLDMCSAIGQLRYEIWPKNETANGTANRAITTLITITNYDKYQHDGTVDETQAERLRNGDGTVTETEEEGKKERRKEGKTLYGDFVRLTTQEHEKLVGRFGQSETEEKIERLNNYIGSKGKRYKSHYHTILNWSAKDEPKQEQKPKFQIVGGYMVR